MAVETLKDYMPGAPGVARRWMDEIDLAGEWQRNWEDRCTQIISRYEGNVGSGLSSSFNILHSNTETLRPALFGQTPLPDIRRRKKMPGDADREAAELLERAIRYTNDTAPYEQHTNSMITDLLLTGRGTMRVRYLPTIVRRDEPVERVELEGEARFFTANMNEVDPGDVVEDDAGARVTVEELQFERADIEHVPYNDFRHTPAKRWADVRAVFFRHYFTRSELREAFGKNKGDRTALTVQETKHATSRERQTQPDIFLKAEVWEVWDKTERQILFVSPGYIDGPLATFDDGPEYYNLQGFFPLPEPLRTIESPTSLLPIPEFIIYQDLADELDEITAKIRKIIDTVDVKGAYDGALPELGNIYGSSDVLTPIPDWRAFVEKGGLTGMVDFLPIEPQVRAFVALTQQRELLLNTIYQTVGISDLARGQSDPRETATAQRLKGDFGQFRLTPRQRGVQRYLRDMMRLQAEMIGEKFEKTTLEIMTGIQVTEPIELLLRLDALRNFAVDIETDSTISVDQAKEQADVAEMLQGLAAYAQAAQGLPDAARLPLLQAVVRKFKLGRDIELAIEESSQKPPKPDPEALKVQADQQAKSQALQLKAVDSERDFKIKAQELALKAREIGLKEDQAEAQVIQALGAQFEGGDRGAA